MHGGTAGSMHAHRHQLGQSHRPEHRKLYYHRHRGKKRTDELCEDPRHEVVLAANNAPSDNFLTFISTETHKILGKITFDGKDPRGDKILANGIEQCQWNPRDEKFYLAIPDIGGSDG